jgi:hypothetical protein
MAMLAGVRSTPLSMKSFHEVRAGNVHEYFLKSRIGKVSPEYFWQFPQYALSHRALFEPGVKSTLS